MNRLEAREFVRGVVTRWLDAPCGDVLPTDRVDGGPLRFGLDAATDREPRKQLGSPRRIHCGSSRMQMESYGRQMPGFRLTGR